MQKNPENRTFMLSTNGVNQLLAGQNQGKGIHWTDDVNTEMPIKVRESGFGSETPMNIHEVFEKTV